ncbi:MAG TPA: MFS transporter [Clostridia bacterium]|nr:MFS transporter [Clostridia bacterium]
MQEAHASLKENLRALPRGAWILYIGTFLNKFGAFVLPFLAIYMTSLGYSSAQAGLAIGAYGVGTLIACFIGGCLADRLGRRKTIVLSMFAVAVTLMSLSQARSLSMIVLFSALAGLTGELYRPACNALLADLVPTGRRLTAFAAYRVFLNAGWALGPATAGLLAQKSFLWLFVGNAASSVIFGIIAWFALPAGLRGTRVENGFRETWSVLRADRRFRQVLLACLGIALVFVQMFSTMSMEITQSGFSPSVYGLVVSLNGLLVVLGELPMTTITKRFPARRVMALGFVLIGIGFASNAFTRTIPLLVLTVILFTIGEMISMPVANAYVADLAPEHQRGLYMGTYGLIWSVAFICGPSIGMFLFSINPMLLWPACGVLGLLAAIIISARPQRRDAPAPVPKALTLTPE